MIPVPTKRRKSNSSTAIPIPTASGGPALSRRDGSNKPSNRASFQSPTKASLARAQPDLLSHVLGRSAVHRAQRSETRGLELQDSQASRGNAPTNGQRVKDVTLLPPDFDLTQPELEPSQEEIKRKSTEPESSLLQTSNLDNNHVRRSTKRALFSSKPPQKQVLQARDVISTGEPKRELPPTLPNNENNMGEPDLPPTPTQLGIQKLVFRSRDSVGSSPSLRFTKAKSLELEHRYEFRSRRVNGNTAQSVDQDESVSATTVKAVEYVPEEILKKQKLRDELAAQLQTLKYEVDTIEDAGRRIEESSDHASLNEGFITQLLSLLTSDNPSCAPPPKKPPQPTISTLISCLLPFSAPKYTPKTEPERTPPTLPKTPFALQQPSDPLPFLTLFAPLSLTTQTSTSSSSLKSSNDSPRLTVIHEYVLSPPPNYPQSIYKLPITVKTDPEKQNIISLSIPDSSSSSDIANIPIQLRLWMDNRLLNPLLKQDVSGLCWGACRYWETSISRAKVWLHLERLHANMLKGLRSKDMIDYNGDETEEYTPRKVVPHLERSSFLFTNLQNTTKYQVLISCPIHIDLWTSEPFLEPDICIATSALDESNTTKVENEARCVFWNLLKYDSGDVELGFDKIIKATEAVVEMLYEERALGGRF
ncbi:hypothetical protein LOZ66_002979 [Ophidiomyces ophidiicola]|nr:hypothetical protein LOZ66_002979 [Ophidiomyces ophidiicola]